MSKAGAAFGFSAAVAAWWQGAGTRQQRRARHLWRAYWALWLGLGTLAAVAAWCGVQAQAQAKVLAQQQAALQAAAVAASQAVASLAAGPLPAQPDFTRQLPATAPVPDFLLALERARAQTGVALAGVQVLPATVPAGQLQHTDLVLDMRGSYPPLKQALAELLARFPGLTLVRFSLRRGQGPEDVQAQWVLRLWARPLSEGGPSGPAGQAAPASPVG